MSDYSLVELQDCSGMQPGAGTYSVMCVPQELMAEKGFIKKELL